MIIEINDALLDEVIAFAWEYQRYQETCSFPKYASFEALKDVFVRSFNHEDDQVLACIESGELIGVLNLQVKRDDLYLQSVGGIFAKRHFNEVAAQFMDYIKAHYPGFELYIGYPIENQVAISYLENIQAELLDACVTMKLQKANFNHMTPRHEVVPLPSERYEEYAIFHDTHNPTMYWTSTRIFNRLDLWNIYVIIEQNNIVGSLLIKEVGIDPEIFALSIDEAYLGQGLELDLLSASMDDCFSETIEHVLFFVDEDDLTQIEATLKVGFKQIDTYRCYKLNT